MKGFVRKETALLKSKGERTPLRAFRKEKAEEIVSWVHRPICQKERMAGARLCRCRKVCQAYV